MKIAAVLVGLFLGALLLTMIHPVASLEERVPIVNLMIDVDTAPSPDSEQLRIAEADLHTLYEQIRFRNGTATLFLTQDVANSRIRLLLAQYSILSKFEFAISGAHSSEKLSDMALSEQKAILEKSIEGTGAAKVCGKSEIAIKGFMPPSFDQNEDTYRAIADLGIEYDAGFQAGLIYLPGHENDVWPYQVDSYGFYAVPVSTYDLLGQKMPVYDRYAKDKGMNASQWYEVLVSKLEQSSSNNEPLVILLSTSISGSGEYKDALVRFLDYAESKKAIFVNTIDLVNKVRTGVLAVTHPNKAVCTTCDQDGGVAVSISLLSSIEAANSTNTSGQEAIS